jgi:hypothetical protein
MTEGFELTVSVKNRSNHDVNVHAVPAMGHSIIVEPGMDGETKFPGERIIRLRLTSMTPGNVSSNGKKREYYQVDNVYSNTEASEGFVVLGLSPREKMSEKPTKNGSLRNGFKNIDFLRIESGNDFGITKKRGWCELTINFPCRTLPNQSLGNVDLEIGIRY